MTLEEAKSAGATGLFENKYGEKVKVYTIGDFSKEICGGPHVSHTGELGHFKIKKEESSSAGVRRIKAILEWEFRDRSYFLINGKMRPVPKFPKEGMNENGKLHFL